MFLSFISLPLHRPPLKALGIGTDAQTMHSYLGWEQEFFVISADHFKARPDLVNCGRRDYFRNVFPQFLKIGCSSTLWGIILPGWFDYIWLIRSPKKAAHHRRTLFGTLPTRHQQGDLNYFQPIPGKVQELLDTVQAEMLKIGCPMAVKHNEVGATRNARKLRSF